MKITVTIHGESDIPPYTKIFEFQGVKDVALVASCERIKKMLECGQRININETLLLLSAFVASSIEGKNTNTIIQGVSAMLSENQVMVGVPEMLQRLDFKIVLKESFEISIDKPIRIWSQAPGSTV